MSVGSDGERLTISKLAAAAGLDPRDPEQLHEALEGITVLRLDWQRIKLLEHMELVPSVHDLYLQHNAIRSMRPLESLTQLRFVVLSHNQINRIEGVAALQQLQALDLSHNAISDLEEDALPPSLTMLLLHSNPCSRRPFYRQRVVAALPRLKLLDETRVTSHEREMLGLLPSDDEEEEEGEEGGARGDDDLPPAVAAGSPPHGAEQTSEGRSAGRGQGDDTEAAAVRLLAERTNLAPRRRLEIEQQLVASGQRASARSAEAVAEARERIRRRKDAMLRDSLARRQALEGEASERMEKAKAEVQRMRAEFARRRDEFAASAAQGERKEA